MTYEAFAILYKAIFKTMMSYSCNQVGSGIYAEKMADLSDAHPEWAERAENEWEAARGYGRVALPHHDRDRRRRRTRIPRRHARSRQGRAGVPHVRQARQAAADQFGGARTTRHHTTGGDTVKTTKTYRAHIYRVAPGTPDGHSFRQAVAAHLKLNPNCKTCAKRARERRDGERAEMLQRIRDRMFARFPWTMRP